MLLIGILFGLAMDYEVFLVSRMREHFVRTGEARESIVTGYGQSGRVVTAAALIMIARLRGVHPRPRPVIKSIGLSLAFGVLVDAFVVRMTLVPAVMALLGHRAWWLPAPARAARAGRSTSRASGSPSLTRLHAKEPDMTIHNHTKEDRRRPKVAAILIVPVVVAIVLTLFAWPNARLEPRDLPVGVVGLRAGRWPRPATSSTSTATPTRPRPATRSRTARSTARSWRPRPARRS